MIIKDGIEYGIDNTVLTTMKNELINQLQDKKITWNGEEKLLTTVLQDINTTASGKANIIVIDELPTTLTKNSQYWTKKKADGSEELTTGRHIYIVDALGVATYVGKSDADLTLYFKKENILTAKDTSADDTKIYSAKAVNDNFLQLSGGTLTGQLKFSTSSAIQRETADDYIRINGGTGISPYFMLCGKDRSGQKGYFHICARNDDASTIMSARPDGTLTWGGNDISGKTTTSVNNTTTHPDLSAIGKMTGGTINITKCGKVVQISFVDVQISETSTSGSLLIATLKSTYKPPINAGGVMFFTNSQQPAGYVWIRPTTGEIVIFDSTKTATSMFGSVTYLLY